MRKLIVQFLILALFSLNSYAGPFVDRNRPDIRPDIRPGQRGSIAQDAMGASHNQYSILNPGSNQSVFVRNNILLQQLYGNNANTNGYMTFNPQSSLPGSGVTVPLDAVARHLLETNGGNALANRVAASPFASKVAKSQTQGMVFVNSANSSEEAYTAGTLEYSVNAYLLQSQFTSSPTTYYLQEFQVIMKNTISSKQVLKSSTGNFPLNFKVNILSPTNSLGSQATPGPEAEELK
jgi:hypothetical protein